MLTLTIIFFGLLVLGIVVMAFSPDSLEPHPVGFVMMFIGLCFTLCDNLFMYGIIAPNIWDVSKNEKIRVAVVKTDKDVTILDIEAGLVKKYSDIETYKKISDSTTVDAYRVHMENWYGTEKVETISLTPITE